MSPATDRVAEYDPTTNTWTSKAISPAKILYATAQAVNGKIYYFGGRFNNGVLNDKLYIFDTQTNTWTTKSSMYTPRYGLISTVLNNKIYAIAGYTASAAYNFPVEVYDPVKDIWTSLANSPSTGLGQQTGANVVNGKIYIFGGIGGSHYYTGTYSFTPPLDVADSPTNLIAIGGDSKVDLSWNSVTGATYYNIKGSTNAGGPYATIQSNVTETTFTDTTVTNGTTYYYVVSAVNSAGESVNSNEASATPTAPTRIVLKITMTNGLEQEFDLSKSEFNSYVNWFDSRAAGIGSAKYKFDNQHLKGPFSSRKNSLVFDKILKYDFDEYAVDGSTGTAEITPVTKGVALTLTLETGTVEEFILSNTEYDAFSTWYDAKPSGTGLARYTFENPLAKGPFLNRSNVIIFDEISEIDVDSFDAAE